jgi:hypothetical protein
MNTIRLSLGTFSLFWIELAAFALTVLFVNPLRETAMEDAWSYVLTVEHPLQTGSYRPHGWLTRFQATGGGKQILIIRFPVELRE